jgi:ornithine cyclodeaminase
MPSEWDAFTGVKIASVAPANPAAGLSRINGAYLLLDAATLVPVAMLDGSALTLHRTSAVSALAAKYLAAAEASRLMVFGTGPQARAHIEALAAVRPVTEVLVVGRSDERSREFAASVDQPAIRCRPAVAAEVGEADIVCCATSACRPLFDGSRVADHACVIAIGSHEPDVRELDSRLLERAQVVVEDVRCALREAGDVVMAVDEGMIGIRDLVGLSDIVRRWVAVAADRPRVFKSVGMAWEDLVVAAVAYNGQSRPAERSAPRQPAQHSR